MRVATVTAANGRRDVIYQHTDHLSSLNVVTDSSGAVEEIVEYEPFGSFSRRDKYGSNAATSNWYFKRTFTGHQYDDESGLLYLGARYLDPSLGRFITPDTIVQNPSDPQTLNRYSYTSNNPINRIDPDGHSWWKKVKKFFQKW